MGIASTTKILKQIAGTITEFFAITTSVGVGDAHAIPALNASGVLDLSIVNGKTTSAGAGDAGKLAALDGAGRLDASFMPVGIGADTATIIASEILTAGDFVNVWNNASVANVRKADASTAGKESHGFVLVGVAASAFATVYFEGTNTQQTGLTAGTQFLSSTVAGKATTVVPSGTGKVIQSLGIATSATSINFEAGVPITLA